MAIITSLTIVAYPSPAHAAEVGTITTSGPLTTITTSSDLNCDVRYEGDSSPEFYSAIACGTLVAVDGVLYGPATIPAGGSASPRTAFTHVSQEGPTGTGAAADPFQVTTVVDLGGSGLRLTQRDTYVRGQQKYSTNISLQNSSGTNAEVVVYRAGDCYVANSDFGTGSASNGAVSCVSTTGRLARWIPSTPGSHYFEDGYSAVWARIGAQLDFPDTFNEQNIDNGAGLSWRFAVPGGASRSVSHSLAFAGESQGTSSDQDGDGLLDSWETNGLDSDGDGQIDLDLPAMGASPDHKDLFVEVDWMQKDDSYIWLFSLHDGLNFAPDLGALKDVSDAFAQRGVRAHIDAGSNSIMNPVTGEKWGDRTRANRVPYDKNIVVSAGGNYDWSKFNQTKATNLDRSRDDVFHYAIYGDRYDNSSSSGVAQVSGNPRTGDSFLVTQGAWTNGNFSRRQESGTFMHELGHTLGLKHGGGDDFGYKPNYQSIMNYAWQMGGRPLDYSASVPQELYEDALWEGAGLPGADGVFAWYCRKPGAPGGPDVPAGYVKKTQSNGAVDWDCDGSIEDVVAADVNAGLGTLLTGFDDWSNLKFDGGAVGVLNGTDLGDQDPPPATTSKEDPEQTIAELQSRDSVADSGDGSIEILGPTVIFAGVSGQALRIKVNNLGNSSATYSLGISGLPGLAETMEVGAINGGENHVLSLPVDASALNPGEYSVGFALHRPGEGDAISTANLHLSVPDMSDPAVRAQARDALLQLSSPRDGVDEQTRLTFVNSVNSVLDADGDGVLDDIDKCPGVAGAGPNGCTAPIAIKGKGTYKVAGSPISFNVDVRASAVARQYAPVPSGRILWSVAKRVKLDARAISSITSISCPSGYTRCATISGQGALSLWDATHRKWQRATRADFTATAYDGGTRTCAKGARKCRRDKADAFGVDIPAAQVSGEGVVGQLHSGGIDLKLSFTTAPAPTISGNHKVGEKLRADVGGWSPVPDKVSYQWYRSGKKITKANKVTYVLTKSDRGRTMTVRVTGSKPGYLTTSRDSSATPVVGPAMVAPIPRIVGKAMVDQTLKVRQGGWGPSPVNLAYQWYRRKKPIPGATQNEYRVQAEDVSQVIRVVVSGTKEGYTTVARASASTKTVSKASFATSPNPRIEGSTTVGQVLTAVTDGWDPSPSRFKYAWYRNGARIDHADQRTYTLAAADRSKVITVAVTADKPGYKSVIRKSAKTAVVS